MADAHPVRGARHRRGPTQQEWRCQRHSQKEQRAAVPKSTAEHHTDGGDRNTAKAHRAQATESERSKAKVSDEINNII